MDSQKNSDKQYQRTVDEKEKEEVRESIVKEIIEKTLIPTFTTKEQADESYGRAEICVFAYSKKYLLIPAPFDFGSIMTYCYPETENDLKKLICDEEEVERIWNMVCGKGEEYNFIVQVSNEPFGKDGHLYLFFRECD